MLGYARDDTAYDYAQPGDIVTISSNTKILGFDADAVVSELTAYGVRNGIQLVYKQFGSDEVMVLADTLGRVEVAKEWASSLVVDISSREVGNTIPIGLGSYVYFLLLHGDLVYIGQTCDICARISSHYKQKKFDGIIYEPFAQDTFAPNELNLLQIQYGTNFSLFLIQIYLKFSDV